MYLLERQIVVAAVRAKIAPYVGETMAAASVKVHCEKLGIDGEHVDDVQLDQLLQRIRNGLVIFIGPDRSQRVVTEIREALRGKGVES